ncbi:MAG: hypothetical protein RLZZ214_114, partial [Verrucomicrobiota bacterium]
MRLILTALTLVSPAVLLAREKGAPAPQPKSKIPAVSMLPDGSELKEVMIPRYDENNRLTSVLKSKKMILVNDEQIVGQTIAVEFFNSDQTPRGRIDLQRAVFYQNKGLIVATEAVEMKSDRMRTYGTGLYYSIEQGRGFLTGPVRSIIEKPAETTMNTPTSPLRATALLGMSLFTQALLAAPPPPVTAQEMAEVKKDAASKAAEAAASGAAAHASLESDLAAAEQASKDLAAFLTEAAAPALPPDAVPPPDKPLAIKNSPNDTVINCTGGAYFDADAGVLVYLKNVTVKDPRYDMTGANELKIFFEKKPVEEKKEGEPKPPATDGESGGPEEKSSDKSADKKKSGVSGDMGAKFGDVERIVATGAVRIDQKPVDGKDPIKASGAIFTYNLKTDQMILSGGYPWFTQGATYMRAKEPNLILRLFPNTGSFRTEGNWESGGNLQQKEAPPAKKET